MKDIGSPREVIGNRGSSENLIVSGHTMSDLSEDQGRYPVLDFDKGEVRYEPLTPSPPDVDALLTQLHERHGSIRIDSKPGAYSVTWWGDERPFGSTTVSGSSLREALQAALEDTP